MTSTQELPETTTYNALIVQAIQQILAAMHLSFRAVYKQCLLTSHACRYKFPFSSQLPSSQVPFIRKTQSSFQPVSVSASITDWSQFFSFKQSSARTSVYRYLSDQQEVWRTNDNYNLNISHHQIDVKHNSGLIFNILNALSQPEMPKRKRSDSEHSKRKRTRSEGADRVRKRSHSKHSKRKRSHSEPGSKSKKKKKSMDKESRSRHSRGTRRSSRLMANKKSGQADELALESLVNSIPKHSKQLNADTHSSPKAQSSKKERASTSSHKENSESKRFKHHTHRSDTPPPGWSSIAKMKLSSRTTSLFDQKKGRSYPLPPSSCGFTQRDFSTMIPSNRRVQHKTSTPPPGWSSAFSTTRPLNDRGKDRNHDKASAKSSHSSSADRRSEQQHTGVKHGQGPRRHSPFDFRRHWKDSSLGRRHKNRPYAGMDFTVMSYNVLAQKLIEMNDYLYHHCPQDILNWEFRRQNLIREITTINSDIVCLQEVQGTHFVSFYEPEMKRLGYNGVFKQRTGDKHDGCATFFKASRFDLIDSKRLEYRMHGVPLLDRDNVAVVLLLQPKGLCQTERVCVANTHLLFNPKRGDIKLAQLGMLLAEIDKLSHIPNGNNKSHHPVIMCGDFNSVPQCSLVAFVQTGTLDYDGLRAVDVSGQEPRKSSWDLTRPLWPHGVGVTDKCQYRNAVQQRQVHEATDESKTTASEINSSSEQTIGATATNDPSCSTHPKVPQNSSEDKLDFSSTLAHPFTFLSSYICNKNSKEVTTNHKRTNCTVDYIFHASNNVSHDTKQLRILSRLSLFTDDEATDMGGLPNAKWSSDHFSLAVKFLLMPNKVDDGKR